jgi:hypothetical protein
MTAFKELLIGGYVLRFWPSDNGWMCGITPQMMEALQQKRTWVGLTDEEIAEVEDEYIVDYRIPAGSAWNFAKDIEAKLKEKNT